jgi:probable HAF family extracellular repeat protein
MATDIDVKSMVTLNDNRDPTFNQLLGINNQGTIAGYFGSGAAGHPNQGYTLTPPYGQGNYHNENFLGSVQTQVTGINNKDLTVGFWADSNNANLANNNFGFVEHDGVFTDVVDPNGQGKAAGGMTVEQLLGVNDKDKAVGFWTDANGNNHGFTYDVGSKSFNEVNIGGFASTTTTAINNAGHIAGFVVGAGGNDVSFIKEGNAIDWLSGPKGSVSVQALGINNEDQVVGSYTDAAGATHGFLFDEQSKTYATIDAKNGVKGPTAQTVLNGINDKGQVVGFFLDNAGNTDGLLVNVSVHHS